MNERVGSGRRPWLAICAALVAVSLWASAFTAIKAVVGSLSPGGLALGRLTIGSLVLGAFVRFGSWSRLRRDDVILLILAGVTVFGLYNMSLNEAERRIDAGIASMLVNISPLLVIALAAMFLNEKTSKLLLIGGAISLLRVLLIGLSATSGETPLVGVGFSLGAALAYAIGLVATEACAGPSASSAGHLDLLRGWSGDMLSLHRGAADRSAISPRCRHSW